jgi:hypothetical protein
MPALTRRRYPERQDCWHVYYGDVHRAVLPNGRKLVTLRPSKSVSLEMFLLGIRGVFGRLLCEQFLSLLLRVSFS